MKFIESFRKLFNKKESEGTKEKRQKIERTLNAKILKDIKKEKELLRFSTDAEAGFIDTSEEEKEKEMRRLIEKKRKERLEKEKAAKKSAKKKLNTLSSNF